MTNTSRPPVYPPAYRVLRAQLAIDMIDIDNELMKMPQVVQDACELAVEAADNENACELAYDVLKASIGQSLREQQERISEAAIERQLPLYDEIKDARNAYNHAKTYTKLCDDLVRALRTKSSLLQKTSDLIISGYITPSAAYERRREAVNTARRQGQKT